MLQKIKYFIAKIKREKIQKENMKKAKKYYEILRAGAAFLKYIHEDLIKERNSIPRNQRRRIEDSIIKKGQFTKEIVNRYQEKIDNVLEYIKIQEKKKK